MSCAYRDDGEGITKDDVQAFGWFQAAAENDHLPAQSILGYYCYEYGIGVTTDLRLSCHWYCEAANKGDSSKAQLKMGWLLENGIVFRQNYQ